jgi:tRNA dimethylallyltransferase
MAQIEALHSQNKLPILVGGTHYYIQALLWHQQLIAGAQEGKSLGDPMAILPHSSLDPGLSKELETLLRSSDPRDASYVFSRDLAQSLHSLLSRIDPSESASVH